MKAVYCPEMVFERDESEYCRKRKVHSSDKADIVVDLQAA
jgi:hypothetical protein